MNMTDVIEPHLCSRQKNMSQLTCCKFVLLLNDTERLPFCDDQLMSAARNSAALSDVVFHPSLLSGGNNGSRFNQPNTYTTPIYLNFPPDVPEDHVTFLFGIFLLISLAVCCTIVILKLTKPKISEVSAASLSASYGNSVDYEMMMFLPYSQRRSSVLLFLRSITCRSTTRQSRRTSLSVVSNSSFLPSYRAATTCSTVSPGSVPPPPYEELNRLTDSNNNISRPR